MLIKYYTCVIALLLMLFSPEYCFGASRPESEVPGLNSGVFQDDLSRIDHELNELSALEQLVAETHLTQSKLTESCNPLIFHLLDNQSIIGSLFGSSAPEGERLMDIPGFLWGFCCSFFGVLLVYLSIDDRVVRKKEGAQSIIGCAAGTVIFVGLYLWLIFAATY